MNASTIRSTLRPVLVVGNTSSHAVTGLTKALDLLLEGLNEHHLPYKLLDKSVADLPGEVGAFRFARAVATLRIFLSYWPALRGVEGVYMTIASTRAGFFRDSLYIWLARLFGKRIVVHLHGGGYGRFYDLQAPWIKPIIRHTLAKTDTIIVLGEGLREQFKFVPNVESKLKVVPNGLSKDIQINNNLPKQLDTPIKLLYLSNLMESKGYLDILEACALLRQRGIAFRCDYCGDFVRTSEGTELTAEAAKANFLQRIKELGLENNVFYHGIVKGAVKQTFLQEAHLFLLPTYHPWEGQPISIIEALAFGTPVITTPYRGVLEQVKDGYNGYYVAPKSPNEIATAIMKSIANPEHYHTLSKHALSYFEANFSRDVHIRKMVSAIYSLESLA